MTTLPTLLTTEQVARRVGKSVSQINRLATAGVLEPVIQAPGPTGARLYDAATVLAFVQGVSNDQSSD